MEQDVKNSPEVKVISLLLLAAAVAGFWGYAKLVGPDHSSSSGTETGKPDWGGEGTLLLAPEGGPDPSLTRLVEPGVMSIVFSDEDTAREFYEEARSNGERVCLADLGPQLPEFRGQRWWLFTC